MATIIYSLTGDEVREGIAYPLICETMCSSIWQTGKVRRRWLSEFTESERKACYKLKALAYRWHLVTGVPDEVVMRAGTLALWKKLEAFCATV